MAFGEFEPDRWKAADAGIRGAKTTPNAIAQDRPVHDVYVRVLNVFRPDRRPLHTTTVEGADDTVMLDWEIRDDGSRRLVGVEVLGARGVEMDVVHGRPHGTGPEWRPAEDL